MPELINGHLPNGKGFLGSLPLRHTQTYVADDPYATMKSNHTTGESPKRRSRQKKKAAADVVTGVADGRKKGVQTAAQAIVCDCEIFSVRARLSRRQLCVCRMAIIEPKLYMN